jgi:membrane associated rhomboid family serine protease
MFDSVIKDIRYELTRGNTLTKIILINCAVFIALLLAKIIITTVNGGDSNIYYLFTNWITLPTSFGQLMYQPWSLFTYSFVHEGLIHILFNMLLLYWFGAIAGDLIGDRRIFPIYFYGAFFGGLFAVLCLYIFPIGSISGFMVPGSSASVMAILFAAATLAPDYMMRLILIGSVRIKYIVLVLLFINVISISASTNIGNSLTHIGGALTGFLFIVILRTGRDPSWIFHRKNRNTVIKKRRKNEKSKIISIFDTVKKHELKAQFNKDIRSEYKLDLILEKIKKTGKESLTEEELNFLEKISKS